MEPLIRGLNVRVDAGRLAVDFGTSSTVGVLSSRDGRSAPLLFDGSPLLPSAVCADSSGELLVGADAVDAASAHPQRCEPHPKRRIDDHVLVLGDVKIAVADAIGAVLRRVVGEASRVAGTPPAQVVLTHPVSWSAPRKAVLVNAAAKAGISDVRLIAEPVAAGHYFAEVLGRHLPVGGHLLVYDLGAGTIDASVLQRTPGGFAVKASHGLPDVGGLDIDVALVAYILTMHVARDRAAMTRLMMPRTAGDRRCSRLNWAAVRAAKETLSRSGSVVMRLPLFAEDVPLDREQLDAVARPVLDRTVIAARAVLLEAKVPEWSLAAVVLAGGASQMPLVARLLDHGLGVAPTVVEQPQLVVAKGALTAAAIQWRSGNPPTAAALVGRGYAL
jgi:molecular chaperone DnaK (HSP70)